MLSNISMIAGAFVAIGVEAQYNNYYPQPSYGSAHQHRPQQYQYYQPYYQAYSYGTNTSSVPTGWYSATQQYRPIAIPYIANKNTETIYAECNNTGKSLSLSLTQMPGQPIQVKINSIDGTLIAARADDNIFKVLEYGCEIYDDANILANNKEYNPIEEKKPDGIGAADFQDSTRGRIDGILTTAAGGATSAAAIIAAQPVQNDFL